MGKTYFEKKNPSGAYAFISYSHADGEAVERLLAALNDYGADFWYDAALKTGQNWLDKVKEVTADKSCCGILYFVSRNFIFSEACLKEFDILADLEKTHKKFGAAYILLDDEDPVSFQGFIASATKSLLSEHPAEFDKIIQRTGYFSKNFDRDRIYKTSSFGATDNDALVTALAKDVFASWGCMSQESGKIDALLSDGLVTADYRVKTGCRIVENLVRGQDAEWKVFAYNGDTLSAVLVAEELYGAKCLSLAAGAMDAVSDGINGADANEKHLQMDADFISCLKTDARGKAVRFLRAAEHENHYLRIKEALEKIPLTDPSDDGYFFVQDSQGGLLFADRGSEDVYRDIHVDAYASLVPVIDIDYNKYRLYLQNKNK